ncbi:MAG TPA: methyltransferase domain-containing protein [Candidatus Angelobacter sp.]|nr:methyltransferase domain-containing protein [Candidatus Angelobacter sp.]
MDEKTRWDKKHSERANSSFDPDPFLVKAYDEFLSGARPATALDVAGGAGRHAIWLAGRGWNVTLIDISEVGLRQAEENARQNAAMGSIVTKLQDLNAMQDLGREQYDLVVVFSFLQRELFPALLAAIKPGGHVIYKTFTTDQLPFGVGPSDPRFLLQPNELLRAFQSMRILHYHETSQRKGVAELVARK